MLTLFMWPSPKNGPAQGSKSPQFVAFQFTVVKFVQPLKAEVLIVETEVPIVISVNPVQFENVLSSINVTEFGIATDVKIVQFIKAFLPMVSTELPIVADAILVQP